MRLPTCESTVKSTLKLGIAARPDATQTVMGEDGFDKYLDLLAKEGAWGSALEVTAIANTC